MISLFVLWYDFYRPIIVKKSASFQAGCACWQIGQCDLCAAQFSGVSFLLNEKLKRTKQVLNVSL
tara:strand:+ start:95 stop:289 length:195 start_codon:yes stop_codon:yes gene_type:complete